METYLTKLKHIIPTFLAVCLGTVFGLALIRWIFCLQFSIIDIKEDLWTIWLPLIFPWIPITLWLRQRFRILTFKDNDKGRFGFQMLSWLAIALVLLVSQAYLTTATGKLQNLTTIKEIEKVEKVRYYHLTNFAVALHYSGSHTDFSTSGKYNKYLNFDIYFVIPILSDTSERISGIPHNWYGTKYHKQISNNIGSGVKEQLYQAFYDECIKKMNAYDFHSLDHFERIPTSEDRQHYLKAIEARTKQAAGDDFVVLEPIQERYEDRNGNTFAWSLGSFGIGLVILLFALIWPGYSEAERKRFLSGEKPKQDDLVDMLCYLIPRGDHFATSILLDITILVFLAMVFSGVHIISPNGLELLQWGANRRHETMSGEWWRLLTSMFLHGGIMHLLMNIAGLVIAAIFVEPILGRKKYFILYVLSGICGSLASIGWYPNTISVGASGAIFGLYGAIFGLLLTNAFPKEEKKALVSIIGVYVVINLLWGLTGGIDNAAHIGGLVSGALLGFLLYKREDKSKNAM